MGMTTYRVPFLSEEFPTIQLHGVSNSPNSSIRYSSLEVRSDLRDLFAGRFL